MPEFDASQSLAKPRCECRDRSQRLFFLGNSSSARRNVLAPATFLVAHDAAALEDLPFLPELSKVAEGPPPDSKAEESSSPGSAPGRSFDRLGFRGLGSRFGAMLSLTHQRCSCSGVHFRAFCRQNVVPKRCLHPFLEVVGWMPTQEVP